MTVFKKTFVVSAILFCGLCCLAEQGEHPEPMHVWSMDANGGRGYMFFEFCPIRLKGWLIKPGKE